MTRRLGFFLVLTLLFGVTLGCGMSGLTRGEEEEPVPPVVEEVEEAEEVEAAEEVKEPDEEVQYL